MNEWVSQSLVRQILENPFSFEWSLQGFGMLRLYLSPEVRLHIWDHNFRTEDVSLIHTHPWDFESCVISGIVYNKRFMQYVERRPEHCTHMQQIIKCGEGGGPIGTPGPVYLGMFSDETYSSGHTYMQRANEIHLSEFKDGTITVIKRTFHADTEHAYVYWPLGSKWVTAEPRRASGDEIEAMCKKALEVLDNA